MEKLIKSIAIIGSGPGGYVAAIRAAQLGAKVYLIEKDELGGTCLNRGCIPTKTYFKNAKMMNEMRNSEKYGISLDNIKLDAVKLKKRKAEVVSQLVGGIDRIINSYNNIEYVKGSASIKSKNIVEIENKEDKNRELKVDNIIIATGSKPKMTETKGIDLNGVITSDDILELDHIPERLVVVGGGVIGIEFASIYQGLGSQVSILISTMLRVADEEMGRRLIPLLRKQGIDIYTDIRAKEIRKKEDGLNIVAKYKNRDEEIEIESDYILVATGREPILKGLKLDEIGIEYDQKGIVVDENFKTNIDGIYAIGDVNTGYPLAHVASAEGVHVVEHIMGENPKVRLDIIPQTIFSLPELSFVGKTEDQLKEEGIEYKVGKFMLGANGKALTMGEGDGLVKILTDMEDNILGAHILGVNSSDLIAEMSLAMANDLKIDSIEQTIHVHPTLSESIYEAALAVNNKAIHLEKPRARRRR